MPRTRRNTAAEVEPIHGRSRHRLSPEAAFLVLWITAAETSETIVSPDERRRARERQAESYAIGWVDRLVDAEMADLALATPDQPAEAPGRPYGSGFVAIARALLPIARRNDLGPVTRALEIVEACFTGAERERPMTFLFAEFAWNAEQSIARRFWSPANDPDRRPEVQVLLRVDAALRRPLTPVDPVGEIVREVARALPEEGREDELAGVVDAFRVEYFAIAAAPWPRCIRCAGGGCSACSELAEAAE